ncbi:hypothetical protein L6452_31925 [Arctium lappa]|uniref:Uncharacterized protein n=1 Tax=Arctium lappa TaxID=4217 RepID=A0ACB8Z3S4_ARCLA|nr:hypothetical protein L6452_31925 [Arctium lappa]
MHKCVVAHPVLPKTFGFLELKLKIFVALKEMYKCIVTGKAMEAALLFRQQIQRRVFKSSTKSLPLLLQIDGDPLHATGGKHMCVASETIDEILSEDRIILVLSFCKKFCFVVLNG